ncbi:MAG: hypothetical protein GXO80_10655 [Chlorobi bacterium]|nr:hypothetical protein [Chlorobiota bacterium]
MIKKVLKIIVLIVILGGSWSFIYYAYLFASIQRDGEIIENDLHVENDKIENTLDNNTLESIRFKYENVRLFEPDKFKNEKLTLIDSLFYKKYISQIEGYSLPYNEDRKNYFISKQRDINDLKAITVSLNWGVCFEDICLLVIDKKEEKLINCISLTEWKSSCDLITETRTEFLTNNVFIMKKNITEVGEENSTHKLKYKGLINNFGQIDTLEIFYNEQIDE